MLYPEFTENKENASILYFPAEGRDVFALQKELQTVYACCTAVGTVTKNGKKYVALEIADDAME